MAEREGVCVWGGGEVGECVWREREKASSVYYKGENINSPSPWAVTSV